MLKTILRLTTLTLLAAAIALQPAQLRGQEKPKAETKETPKKQTQTKGPFIGKLAAMDKTAKTITVGKRTFSITSETKIYKAGKPAILDDAVLGEEVSGGFKTADDGKLVVTKLNIGPKADSKSSEKKSEKKTEK
jgi:hypothetical protein